MLKIFFEKMLQKNLTFSIHRIKSEKGLQFFMKYGILISCNQKPFSV